MNEINQPISIEVKKKCCEMKRAGKTSREIYDEYFKNLSESPCKYESFRVTLQRWNRKIYPDELTLESGTYDGFVAHGATVQVSGTGEIVQAWIKQHATEMDADEFIREIKKVVTPYPYKPIIDVDATRMLEIPLFDMHWGVAFLDYYKPVLDEILRIITEHSWEKIVIPFGQDFFHNDSIVNGQTTKGTVIEKVDMVRAVKEGQQFIYAIIDTAIDNSNAVEVMYSPGNHDRSISWMFMQTLLERYGSGIVDDSLEFRKIITYGSNAVMVTHGDSRRATSTNLAHLFPRCFAEEFANANIREVHAGHLHSEADSDIFGIMVRRLSSGNKTDEWSDREDFIGANKRFMLFDWSADKLKAIHYV